MANLYKRGDIYYFYICSQGRRIRKSTGTTSKVLALKIMKDVEARITMDKFDLEERDIRLSDFWGRIGEYSQTNHSRKSRQRYMAVIAHFKRFLADYPEITRLAQISPSLIEKYKTYRTRCEVNPDGRPGRKAHTRIGANATTINFEVGVLRSFFNLAIEWDFLGKNPTKGIKRLKETNKRKPRFLDRDECHRLLEACEGDLREIFYTFLNTGMRRGELENLEWSDIDWKNNRIKIHTKAGWKPKTGERDIPLSGGMIALLTARKKRNAGKNKSRYVFSSKSGRRTGMDLRMMVLKTAEKAGIEGLTRVHDLRHTFASQLVMNGVDLPTVQKLLGHTHIETTMIYSHLTEDHVAKAVQKINIEMPQIRHKSKKTPTTQ